MSGSDSSTPSLQPEGETNKGLENENQQSLGDGDNNGLVTTASRITWHHRSPTASVENGTAEGDVQRRSWLKFRMRGFDDDEDTDWWFAGTAVPLIAATLAPLANVLSLAALVTYWRENLDDGHGNRLPELQGVPFRDPRWCYDLNLVSLVCGFVGNLFLLFNFTGRIRYIIALPATILIWYVATGILIGITAGMHIYAPPVGNLQTYTQGFWYGVEAAVLYFVCSMLLMLNMLGYFWGHYPQRFNLTDHQRTLILQTMLFFIWLAGGAAVFSHIESSGANASRKLQWGFVDGLYFCDVTILTVGFGDLYPTDTLGQGLVFPYSVGGIVMLGLVISSLYKFASEIGEDNIIKKHISRERSRTFDRTVTETEELLREEELISRHTRAALRNLHISAPYNLRSGRRPTIYAPAVQRRPSSTKKSHWLLRPITRRKNFHEIMHQHHPKLLLMKEERDRFNAMRRIERQTASFKRWWALTMSIMSFAILWCIGAVVFWRVEAEEQGLTYFQALYFCYVSLLTIGYGDISPKSNAGRTFFVVWSLVAVPTMTILIGDLSNTVVEPFKQGTFKLAEFTVLPKAGAWRDWLEDHPRILAWLEKRKEDRDRRRRLRLGMPFAQRDDANADADADSQDLETPGDHNAPSIRALAREAEQDARSNKNLKYERLARRLATAIRNVATDLRAEHQRKYTYEEWVELTRLIRFTSESSEEARDDEEEKGMVEWDWIGEDSPMMSGQSEPEFVLHRLCESLTRYVRRTQRQMRKHGKHAPGLRRTPSYYAQEEEEKLRAQEKARIATPWRVNDGFWEAPLKPTAGDDDAKEGAGDDGAKEGAGENEETNNLVRQRIDDDDISPMDVVLRRCKTAQT